MHITDWWIPKRQFQLVLLLTLIYCIVTPVCVHAVWTRVAYPPHATQDFTPMRLPASIYVFCENEAAS